MSNNRVKCFGMEKGMTNDMTQGKAMKLLVSFMLPVLAGNIFQQFYNVVDSVIVGQFLGEDALAAVGSTGSVVFLVWGLVSGLTSGFSVVIAQQFGAKNWKGMKHYESVSILLCIGIAILMTIVLFLTIDPILQMMNTDLTIYEDTRGYLSVLFNGISITFIFNILAGMLRALGDSKTPLIFLVISSIINIVLDIVFIVNVKLGVAGAAYATLIAQFVSAVLCVVHIIRKYDILKLSKKEIEFSFKSAKRLLAVGVPMGLQFSITAIGTMIVQASLNTLGTAYIAGFAGAGKIQNITTQAFPSLGVAMATYVGQNYGAGRIDRIKEGVKASIVINLCFSILSMIIIYGLGTQLMNIFTSDGNVEMIQHGVRYLHIAVWFYIPLGFIYIYRNTLQGLGDGFVPMMGGVFELIGRAVAIAILAPIFHYDGICMSDPIAWIMALIPLIPVYYWRMGKLK